MSHCAQRPATVKFKDVVRLVRSLFLKGLGREAPQNEVRGLGKLISEPNLIKMLLMFS